MMKRKQDGFKPTNPSGGVKKLKQTSTYFSDTRLIPRIRQYMNAHKNRKVINITSMTEDLQRQYSEYARKKKNAFIKSVEKAYEIISTEDKNYKDTEYLEDEYLKRKNKQRDVGSERDQPNEDDDEKSYSSDNDYAEYEDQNSMNNLMSNLYRNSPARTTPVLPNNTKADSAPTSVNNNSGLSLGKGDNSASLMEDSLFFIDKGGDSENILNSTQQDETESVSSKTSKKRKVTKKTKNKDEEKEKAKKGPEIQTSTVKFEDFGGNEKCLVEVCKLLVHMRHPEVYQQLGVTPPRGFLLHGPPGCGKTLLAHAIAGELELPFIKLAATEIVTGVSGESEEKIRDLFDKAAMSAPCIVFMDEIDAITPKRETASKDMERRIVAQLLSCLDDLNNKKDVHVLVIGATNRPDSLDPALRRAGRFDREIALGIPDEGARCRILQVLCRNLKLDGDFDFTYLARNTPGYVGADLNALTREAALTAVNRVFNEIQKNDEDYEMTEVNSDDTNKNDIIPTCKSETAEKSMVSESYQQTISESVSETTEEQTISESVLEETEKQTLSKSVSENISVMCKTTVSKEQTELQSVLGWLKEHPPLNEQQLQSLCITFKDFEEAMKVVQPSAKREGFATIPDVTWEDIGALQTVREELQLAIMAPIRHPEKFKDLGLNKAQGILLAGPPGCGKTLLAKAISNESGINFISVKGPELLNMYVGESERAVRQVFQRARNSSPCVIFFDELDALCPRRTDGGEGGSSVRVVNQLLTEMDGLEERKQVFIIGATNRPDIIDPAIMRPGRLDKTLYVGLPTPEDRLDIFMTITKKGTRPKLSTEVNLEEVASDPRCQGYSGADLAALIREASVCALKDAISCTSEKEQPSLDLTKAHFEQAFTKVRPSVSSKDHQKYEKIKDKMT